MSDHFTLDVDPELLRAVARKLTELSNHIKTKAGTVEGTPGEIGDKWQGDAAESVKENITALGNQMNRYDEKFDAAAKALKTLAGHYEHALEEKLPELNRKYDAAQTTYDDAVADADRERDEAAEKVEGPGSRFQLEELGNIRSTAVSEASAARTRTWNGLESDFGDYKEELRQKTRTASAALAEAVVVEVSDSQVDEFRRRSRDAGHPSPMRIGALDLFDDSVFTLAGDRQYAADGKEAAENLEDVLKDDDLTDEDVAAYVDSLSQNPAFRRAFIESLDPDDLLRLQQSAHYSTGDDATRRGEIVTDIAQILARGSNSELQGDYPVDSSAYDDLISAYENHGVNEGEGLMMLAEIVQAGQGNDHTWDSGILTEVGNKVLAYEREQVKNDESWSWSRVNHDWRPITQPGRDAYGTQNLMDPLTMVVDSMHHDPEAAQDFLIDNSSADTDKLHYLYDRTAGQYFEGFGHSLGGLLDASTTFVGDGGPGTRDYVSAEIVNDMVEWYGEHPDRYRIMQGQDFVDILTRFMPAVNHPGATQRPVLAGDPNATYSWQRMTMPNLDPDKLATVMQQVFGTDYHTEDGSRPLFQQFSAVQVAAMKEDFMEYAEKHGLEDGHLETLAAEQGELKQRTIDWFTESMKAQGASEDEANASAREAADFIGGLLTETIPVDRLGPGGSIAGAGVDGVKNWALDQWFPLTDNKGEMAAEGHQEAVRNRIHGPDTYLNWLDEAALLDGDANIERYVAENEDRASFTEVGPDGEHHLRDIQQMRAEANAAAEEKDWDSPAIQRWDDFMRYYHDQGEPFLSDHDINDKFQLGTLVEASK